MMGVAFTLKQNQSADPLHIDCFRADDMVAKRNGISEWVRHPSLLPF